MARILTAGLQLQNRIEFGRAFAFKMAGDSHRKWPITGHFHANMQDDPDEGYGRAVIGSIIQNVLELCDDLGHKPQYAFEQLLEFRWDDYGNPLPPEPIDYQFEIHRKFDAIDRIANQYGFCQPKLVSFVKDDPSEPNPLEPKAVIQLEPKIDDNDLDRALRSITHLLGFPVELKTV